MKWMQIPNNKFSNLKPIEPYEMSVKSTIFCICRYVLQIS